MARLADFAGLLRVHQWYKNLVVFIPVVFSLNLFRPELVLSSVLGFASLCLVSSSYYIINDIADRKKDLLHPAKRQRPVASGRVPALPAAFAAMLLLGASLYIAATLSTLFLYSVAFIFAMSQMYTFFLKNEAFADVIAIAINFTVKAVSGIFIIWAQFSLWLIVCTFFLALLLGFGKRKFELVLLGKKAAQHKPVLSQYSPAILDLLVTISASGLLVAYSLYSILAGNHLLIITIPLALYLIARYAHLIYRGSAIAGNPEKVFTDGRMMVGLALWAGSVVVILYMGRIVAL